MYGRIRNIHFVGIGGIGMSGIAEVLLNMGYGVTGSDLKRTDIIDRLEQLGARIFINHSAENIGNADVVVTSSAIKKNNPEVLAAQSQKIPVIPRAEMLAELMRLKYGIAVAGSHGKTTTTSMISTVLGFGGFDPTIVVGGKVKTLGSNAHLGKGSFMVVEADESDGSFLMLSPVIAVVTNIDREHLDYYENMNHLEEAFSNFLNKIPFYGLAVLCLDCPRLKSIISAFKKRFITYGFSPLAEFRGIERRLQIKGESNGVLVMDDYGHHPEEILATFKTLRESFSKRLIVIFQPHRYTRTQILFNDFVSVLGEPDMLHILDIYSAGEITIPGVTSEKLTQAIKDKGHKNVYYAKEQDEVIQRVLEVLRPGDLVLTLGAGNVWKLGEKIVEELS